VQVKLLTVLPVDADAVSLTTEPTSNVAVEGPLHAASQLIPVGELDTVPEVEFVLLTVRTAVCVCTCAVKLASVFPGAATIDVTSALMVKPAFAAWTAYVPGLTEKE